MTYGSLKISVRQRESRSLFHHILRACKCIYASIHTCMSANTYTYTHAHMQNSCIPHTAFSFTPESSGVTQSWSMTAVITCTDPTASSSRVLRLAYTLCQATSYVFFPTYSRLKYIMCPQLTGLQPAGIQLNRVWASRRKKTGASVPPVFLRKWSPSEGGTRSRPLWHLPPSLPSLLHSFLNESQDASQTEWDRKGERVNTGWEPTCARSCRMESSANPHDNPRQQLLMHPIVQLAKPRPPLY